MTLPIHPKPQQTTGTARLGRGDPLLQELWDAKAALNAAAGYSVKRVAEQAGRFDLDATLARLRQQVNH
jgi:hypothetical protein